MPPQGFRGLVVTLRARAARLGEANVKPPRPEETTNAAILDVEASPSWCSSAVSFAAGCWSRFQAPRSACLGCGAGDQDFVHCGSRQPHVVRNAKSILAKPGAMLVRHVTNARKPGMNVRNLDSVGRQRALAPRSWIAAGVPPEAVDLCLGSGPLTDGRRLTPSRASESLRLP